MARKVGELFYEMRATGETLKKDLAEGERQFTKFVDFIKANPVVAASGLGLALAGIGLQAAMAAARVDREFGRVTKVLGASRTEAKYLMDDMVAIARASGKTEESIVALFNTIAQGGPGGAGNVRALAEAAMLLEKLSGLDMNSAAMGLDQVMDTFAVDPSRAREVAALIFAIGQGRAPLNDVFAVFAKIGPAAQAAGIDIETAAAAIVALLDQGKTVGQAANAFNTLAEAGSEGSKALQALAEDGLTLEQSLKRVDETVKNTSKNIASETDRLRNQLRNAFIDIGRGLNNLGTQVFDAVFADMMFKLDEIQRKAASTNGALSAADLLGLQGAVGPGRGASAVSLGTSGPLFGGFPGSTGPGGPLTDPDSTRVGQRLQELTDLIARAEKLSVPRLRALQAELRQLLAAASDDAQQARAREGLKKVGDTIESLIEKGATEKMNRLKRAIADLGPQIERVAKLVSDRLDARDDLEQETKARAKNTESLREQVGALMQSRGAYEKVLLVQQQRLAVEEAEAKAKNAGVPYDYKAVAREIEDNEKLTRVLTALRDLRLGSLDELFQIPDTAPGFFDDVGALADVMAQIASAATVVAGQFGDAGRVVAQMLGNTSQLLGNLSQMRRSGIFTQEVTDAQGNKSLVERNVHFLGALKGQAGLGGVATAVSSSVAFIGAAAGIADALDLFGNRARERARILRERAIAFNAALEDFAIVQRTDLDQQLRQNYVNASAVAEKYGFTNTNFRSASDIDALAAQLREAASEMSDKQRDAAKGFRQAASELDRLASTARDNEEKLRKANTDALARLTEDLNVRRVALELGKEAGDQERDRLALLRQEEEIRAQYGPMAEQYIADLKAITAAEKALAEAVAQRAAVMQRLQDDNDVLGGTAQQRLQRSVDAMRTAFGEAVDGLFDGIDLSSNEGLEAGKQAIRDLYSRLAADGIDESERPLVDFLKRLLGDLDAAVGELPEHLAELTTRLEAWDESVRLFGHTFEEQLAQMQVVLAGKFGEDFDALLGGLDIGSATGRAESKNRIETMLAGILGDGEIAEAERPLYEMLQRLLGIINGAITKAGEEAEAAAAKAEEEAERARAQRATRRQRSQERNELFGIDGAEAVRANIDAVDAAFSALFAQFDLETLAGIEGAQGTLRGLYDEIAGLTDEEVVRKFGMTREEIISAILATNDGLGGLAASLAKVEEEANRAAQASADLAYRINQDYLRSQGRNQEADLAEAKRQRDESKKAAEEAGLTQEVLDQIEATYEARVRDIHKRYADAAAEALAKQQQQATTGGGSAGGNATTGGSNESPVRERRTSTTFTGSIGGLSEVTGQSLAGILLLSETHQATTARMATGIYEILRGGLPAPPLSLLGSHHVTTGNSSGFTLVVQSLTVHVSGVRPEGLSLEEAGSRVAQATARALGDEMRKHVRYLGGGSRQGIN